MRSTLDVAVHEPRDLTAGVRLALKAASPSLFHTPAYADALAAAGARPLVLMVADDDGPVGHLVVVEESAFGFRRWEATAEPALRDLTAAAAFWEGFALGAGSRRIVSTGWRDAATVRLPAPVAAAASTTIPRGVVARQGAFGTHFVDLAPPEDARWRALDKRHRQAARRALDQGVHVTAGETAAAFEEVYRSVAGDTWSRSRGTGPDPSFLAHLVAAGEGEGWLEGHVARDADGVPRAAAVVSTWRGRAHYLYGAASRAVPGASTLLQWRIMAHLADRGVTGYDLGGAALAGGPEDDPRMRGIRRFKARFGGGWETWPRLHLTLRPAAYRMARRVVALARAVGWRGA